MCQIISASAAALFEENGLSANQTQQTAPLQRKKTGSSSLSSTQLF
jgi:hypothetical protein